MRLSLLFLSVSVGLVWSQSPSKPPLSHADYDRWRDITGMTLSPDGRFIAYTLTQPKSDSQLVIRALSTGQEWKFNKGGSAVPAETAAESKDDPELLKRAVEIKDDAESTERHIRNHAESMERQSRDDAVSPIAEDQLRVASSGLAGGAATGSAVFSPDSRWLFFMLSPTRAELDAAKSAGKSSKDQPKPVLAVFDLAAGQVREAISGVRSFRVVGDGAGYLVIVKERKTGTDADRKLEPAPAPKPAGQDQEPKQPLPKHDGDSESTAASRAAFDLMIRDLSNQREMNYEGLTEYSITRDGSQIVYVVASEKPGSSRVLLSPLLDPQVQVGIAAGEGRFYRLTWNEPQTRLLFFHDDNPKPPVERPVQQDGRAGRPQGARSGGGSATATEEPQPSNPKLKLLLWERASTSSPAMPAQVIINHETPGLRPGWRVVDRGLFGFSADGQRINISTAPLPASPVKKEPNKSEPVSERVELDLWHWKDEAIQPMQRVRGSTAANRSFAAVYLLDEQRIVHLGDDDLTVQPPHHGDWAVAFTDKPYRAMTWESPTPRDYSLLNVRTGELRPLLQHVPFPLTASPKGKYLAGFDGKHWFTINVPEGSRTFLTTSLNVSFHNEDSDTPQLPAAYGLIGWSTDEQTLYVADRFDIWKLAVDGSTAENITQIGRGEGIRFRLVRVEKPESDETADREPGLDSNYPWLLAATHLRTQDRGFYRLMVHGQPPRRLVMGPLGYGTPTKAQKANTIILPISTFTSFGDYYATTPDFKQFNRLTDANPQRSDFNWAKAELIHFTSVDGDKLSAILVKPENFDPRKKYPMIVYIYERLSQGYHGYRHPNVSRGQVINPIWYASNGYLVLMPDIAYKIGFPGQSALHCVLPAIQKVVDLGIVEEDAIGINGQSWGGYQIAYMITRTNRFKAAVAGAAVTNMTSAYNGIRWGTGMARQFQYERAQSRIGETLWQAPMKYIDNSPVFMADRVQTPLLMINNDQDDAVPWYQGIEFYLSLRRLGKEVYLLNYNGERHNLARQANARDFALRMHQFFEHHLKGKPMPPWMEQGIPFTERDREKEQWKGLFQPKPEQTAGKE